MQMYLSGQWRESGSWHEVRSPYSGEVVDRVPAADADSVRLCLEAAEHGARQMAALTAHERYSILLRAADLAAQRAEDLAQTVTREQGKTIREARGEAGRLADLFRLCAFEGAQLRGETLPVDSQAGARGKLGFTLRVPCGVVLAITPFNYPLLLVAHKIGPALAAGNAVILKPAERTPLSALKLTQLLLDAGLPDMAIQCVTGCGRELGPALCADPRVRKVSFTGSTAVGRSITQIAGVKKLSLELGSNAPLIVMDDADMEQVAAATAAGGYVNAGQVCISTQRVLVQQRCYGDFLDAARRHVAALTCGDPMKETSQVGVMISEDEAIRVESWIREAVSGGGRLITGGQRQGAMLSPAIVADAAPAMRISCEELFGPAIAVTPIRDIDEAIALANDSTYGLGAGIFTRDLNCAMRFAREVQSGNVMINWTPLWRADLMPYGGFKQSGIGKEGPRYAIQEMTEIKTVVIHGLESDGSA